MNRSGRVQAFASKRRKPERAIYIHAYIHIHIFVCVCVCVYVHTHTHTQEPPSMRIKAQKGCLVKGKGTCKLTVRRWLC
jgi:hypothetical protein